MKPRVIVLTDISSMKAGVLEPDDTQSMVRFLLTSDEFDVEGLIASAYGKYGTRPEYIHQLIDAYALDYPNLIKYSSGYMPPEKLHSLVKKGSNRPGDYRIGEKCDTEASNWIIKCADKNDERPLWILLWCGALDLAQAVWRAKNSKSAEDFERFKSKLRIYSIGDQYDNTGKMIKENYPEIFYITNYNAFRGMYRGGDESLSGKEWAEHNIVGKGHLGSMYPVYDGGDPWGKVHGIKEGDTPSFLYLLYNEDPENPTKESCGGSFIKCGKNQYRDSEDIETARESVYKWRKEFQEDFKRRLDRCQV